MHHADADDSYSAELTRQVRMASSLVDRAPFGICRVSLSRDCFLSANPAICRMLGYSQEELLAVVISRDLYLDARSRASFSEVLRRDRRIQAQEVPLRRKDGACCVFE